MTAIVIRPDNPEAGNPLFRAAYGNRQAVGRTMGEAVGRTMGEALDALAAQEVLPVSAAVLIRRFGPDEFFTQAQHDRMQALVNRRANMTPEEEQELETLIDAELDASVSRTEKLLSSLPE